MSLRVIVAFIVEGTIVREMRALFVTLLEFLFVLSLVLWRIPRLIIIFFTVLIRFGEFSVLMYPLFLWESFWPHFMSPFLLRQFIILRNLIFIEMIDLLLKLFVVVVHLVRGQRQHVASRILERLVTLQTHPHSRLGFLHPLTEFMLIGLDKNNSDVEVAMDITDPSANIFHNLEQIRNRLS